MTNKNKLRNLLFLSYYGCINTMKDSLKRPLVIILTIGITLLVVFTVGLHIFGNWQNQTQSIYSSDCNIAVIPILGEITASEDDGTTAPTTAADTVIEALRQAEADNNIKGVLIRIDSGGGSAANGEAMTNTLKRFTKPSVALIRSIGASSAYMTATGAQHIIASHFSIVGSIGVTESYLSNAAQNAKDGITFEQLSSGPYKDMLNPDKPLTDAERGLIERDLKIGRDWFVHLVSQNRSLPLDQVEKLADGSALPGELALKAGLIDELGDQETAKVWIEKKIGGKVVWCK